MEVVENETSNYLSLGLTSFCCPSYALHSLLCRWTEGTSQMP